MANAHLPKPGLCSPAAMPEKYPDGAPALAWLPRCEGKDKREDKSDIYPLGRILLVLVFLFALRANGAVGKISEEWKAHFKATLIIENCVFERSTFSWGNQTNLYQVRYQEGAFVMREIGSLGDAALDHITGRNMYAGRFGSNYWAIEGGRVLKLFPNAESMINEHRNPEVSLIEAPRRTLLGALYCGFHLLDPTSIEWLGESKFGGSSFQGHRFRGEILEAIGGLPTVFEWHAETDPELQFLTECKYVRNLDMPYYPSEISVRLKSKGKTQLTAVYRILSLKTSHEPLLATWFDSARYFSNSTPSATLMVTNDGLYAKMENGNYKKVLPALPSDGLGGRVSQSSTRAVILGFAVLSAIGLLFVWKHAKEKQKNQRTNQ